MLYKSMSSVCQAKVLFHMPKYRYAVFTPGMLTPYSSSTWSNMVPSLLMFHSFTSGSYSEPAISAPYSAWLKLMFFQYLRSSSSLSFTLGGACLKKRRRGSRRRRRREEGTYGCNNFESSCLRFAFSQLLILLETKCLLLYVVQLVHTWRN